MWRGDGEGQAATVAGGLEAGGIDARIHGTQPMPQAFPTAWARSNWVVLVQDKDAVQARERLRDSGEERNVVDGGPSLRHEQVFLLKLAVASIAALVIASTVGVLFFGWRM